jgi:hypothetical protein
MSAGVPIGNMLKAMMQEAIKNDRWAAEAPCVVRRAIIRKFAKLLQAYNGTAIDAGIVATFYEPSSVQCCLDWKLINNTENGLAWANDFDNRVTAITMPPRALGIRTTLDTMIKARSGLLAEATRRCLSLDDLDVSESKESELKGEHSSAESLWVLLHGVVRGLVHLDPCSSVRVSKGKRTKKHTTAIMYIKGVPDNGYHQGTMNGKYKQWAGKCIKNERPVFKGGTDGKQAIWYGVGYGGGGAWLVGSENMVGTGACGMYTMDTAATPDAVKAPWRVCGDTCNSTTYAKPIEPFAEVKEHEVPRRMQIKMAEMMVADGKRCLGCGKLYTTADEVVYQKECLHHHCVGCGGKHQPAIGDEACVVCAQEGQ